MVRQELWALLLTHRAIRRVTTAADHAGSDWLSFLHTLQVVRNHF
ncbi:MULTISPECIES: hypothetical protein [unclassified Frankia]